MVRLCALLAEAGGYRSRDSGASQYLLMGAALAIVALAIGGFYLWNTRRKSTSKSTEATPEDVFAQLCDAHELGRADRQLITQLARTYNLPQPSAVFVDPWTLDQAAAAANSDAPRFRTLRQKLFGSLPVIGGST